MSAGAAVEGMDGVSIEPDGSGDADAIATLVSAPGVFETLGAMPLAQPGLIKQMLDARQRTEFGFVARFGGSVVGHCSVSRANPSPRRAHAATLTCAVHPSVRRRGIGRALVETALGQAFEWYSYTRVEIVVLEANKSAMALYAGLGFTKEGVHPKYCLHHGEMQTAVTLSRVKE